MVASETTSGPSQVSCRLEMCCNVSIIIDTIVTVGCRRSNTWVNIISSTSNAVHVQAGGVCREKLSLADSYIPRQWTCSFSCVRHRTQCPPHTETNAVILHKAILVKARCGMNDHRSQHLSRLDFSCTITVDVQSSQWRCTRISFGFCILPPVVMFRCLL